MSLEQKTELLKRITVDPQQCGGKPCVRGMRIRVTDILDLLANDFTPTEVLDEFPDLDLDDVRACIHFASVSLDHSALVA